MREEVRQPAHTDIGDFMAPAENYVDDAKKQYDTNLYRIRCQQCGGPTTTPPHARYQRANCAACAQKFHGYICRRCRRSVPMTFLRRRVDWLCPDCRR